MKKISNLLAVLAIAACLPGCATYKPVPEGYMGPVSAVSDSAIPSSGSKALIFALMEVNGNQIRNSFDASASASKGQGFALTALAVSRSVPATPMTVKIKGAHATGAPIHAIFSQITGNFYSVEGTVDFTPMSGRDYVVTGILEKDGSSVWIEDTTTGEPVTKKVTSN